MPLVFQPGTSGTTAMPPTSSGAWSRSSSGQRLDAFLARARPGPARDDGDRVRGRRRRQARRALHRRPRTGGRIAMEEAGKAALVAPPFLSGGGGLVSTAADYHRFTRCCWDAASSTGCACSAAAPSTTWRRTTSPGGADLEEVGRPLFAEMPFNGVGFGLGFSVVIDPVAYKTPVERRRDRLGRRGEHRVLRRPRRADHGDVLHPAAALERAPDPQPAARPRLPGPGRLEPSHRGHGRRSADVEAGRSPPVHPLRHSERGLHRRDELGTVSASRHRDASGHRE